MQFRRILGQWHRRVKSYDFWPDGPIVITMQNFKVATRTDLWVYNAENLCVSFFNQLASIFHLGEGEIKKENFGFT